MCVALALVRRSLQTNIGTGLFWVRLRRVNSTRPMANHANVEIRLSRLVSQVKPQNPDRTDLVWLGAVT